jgi:hypothetical protein
MASIDMSNTKLDYLKLRYQPILRPPMIFHVKCIGTTRHCVAALFHLFLLIHLIHLSQKLCFFLVNLMFVFNWTLNFFSGIVTKINRKGKHQDRALIITNVAMYNFKPKRYKFSQLLRRIEVKSIAKLYIW